MEPAFGDQSRFNEVLISLDQCYVETPGHTVAMKGLQAALHTHLVTGNSVGVVLTGDSGVGKTRLLNKFDEWIERQRGELDLQRAPMVRVESSSDITPLAFNSSLLEAFGDPFWEKGDGREMRKRLARFYQEVWPFGLAIDEFHNFSQSKVDEQLKQTLRGLKRLVNTSKPFMVLCGKDEIREWIRGDEELRGRFLRAFHVPRMELHSKSAIRVFRNVLGRLAEIVPYAKDASPSDDTNILRMFLATLGVFRTTIELNKRACEVASADQSDLVTRDHLAQAFESILADPEVKVDPFRLHKAAVVREATRYSQK